MHLYNRERDAIRVPVNALLAITLTIAWAQPRVSGADAKIALYAATGPELATYSVSVESAALVKQSTVTVPQNVQEAWPHPSRQYLYVTWSNNIAGTAGHHGITAFRIDPKTGALQPHGRPILLAARSVFLTVDIPGKHIVVAYNEPSGATVHRIAANGTLGGAVPQATDLDFGVYAHQVRIDPSNQMIILVTRGNAPTAAKPEDPGALKVFGYKDGVLTNRTSIAPGGGYNFQPRHLEFHPTRPFAFITLERQNKLQVYRRLDGSTLSGSPVFTRETLRDPSRLGGQATSAIHVHPSGRFLYLGNRSSGTTDFHGKRVLADGENSIAVYSINQETGEPTLIQNADTHGAHPRTFAIDPTGRILVVANMQLVLVRDKEEVRPLPATLSVFRVRSDGKLEFARKYDQDASSGRNLFWTGMVELP
ncbi:MAG TPA: beta-propeller fold lactonase family protein [Bryobacteraceae bacterium]|nr:beta-propeller fold lactonase family protein [Bryobacteraceae bacterium]